MNLEIRLGNNSEQALKVLRALASPLDYSINEVADKVEVPTEVIASHPLNPEDFVFLEAAKRGDHEYPDLRVSMYNLGMSYAVDACRILNLKDTAFADDNIPYIGNINYRQAMDLVTASGYCPLNLRLFADSLREIREGAYRNKPVYDGSKDLIKPERLRLIDDEITKARSPYRGRWLSDNYEQRKDGMYVSFYVINSNNNPELITEKLDEATLMEDRRIEMDGWLRDPTAQGTPRKNVKEGDLFSWYPRDNSVAGFGAYSDGALLDCYRYPLGSGPALGVPFCAAGARFEN